MRLSRINHRQLTLEIHASKDVVDTILEIKSLIKESLISPNSILVQHTWHFRGIDLNHGNLIN